MSTGGEDAQSYELQWRFQPRLATGLLPTGALDFPSRFRYIRHLIPTPCTGSPFQWSLSCFDASNSSNTSKRSI
jgi:hypothetical protein